MVWMTETVWCDSGVFNQFSDFFEIGNQFHWEIALTFTSDLTQEIGIPGQVFVGEVIFNLKEEKMLH